MNFKKKSIPAIVFMLALAVFLSGCALAPQLQADNSVLYDDTESIADVSAEKTEAPSIADDGEPALDITLDENRIIRDLMWN
jgi:uncharacterized protein YcfL